MQGVFFMGNLIVSKQEEIKAIQIGYLTAGKRPAQAVADCLGYSLRHVRRLKARFAAEGIRGLQHRSFGTSKASREAADKEVLEALKTHAFDGWGPTYTAEALSDENGLQVSVSRMRRIMIRYGFWTGKKRKIRHRKFRDRRECYGEMVQFDGSIHEWVDGQKWMYLQFIDDATGLIFGRFYQAESYPACADIFLRYAAKFGIPKEFYSDHGSVYYNTPDTKTQFGKVLAAIGCKMIFANSPQAKGRAERSYKTSQDRLVKDLKRKNIITMDEANRYLDDVYLAKHNKKYAKQAAKPEDAHMAVDLRALEKLFILKESRQVNYDWTLKYKTKTIQLARKNCPVVGPKDLVLVQKHLDGTIFVTTLDERIIPHRFIKTPERGSWMQPLKHRLTKSKKRKPIKRQIHKGAKITTPLKCPTGRCLAVVEHINKRQGVDLVVV